MAVVDASVLVSFLVGGGEGRNTRAEQVMSDESKRLLAPHLLDAEVGHSLRRLERAGAISPEEAAGALSHLAELPIVRASHSLLLGRAWNLREKLSFHDALYLALAVELDEPLATADRVLGGVARDAGVEAVVI